MNRSMRRLQAKNNVRCNNNGKPIFDSLTTKEDYADFRVNRHNKKVMKVIKHITTNKMGYTKKIMKTAKEVIKNPTDYSEVDFRRATAMVTRLGQYPNMINLDTYISQLKVIPSREKEAKKAKKVK